MDLTLDEDVEIMFTTHPGQIISRDKLVVKLSPSYNRKIMSDPMESEIEKNWQKRVEENPRMWNGTKFRIDDAYEENGKTIFHLGITCYKDFIGTNWSPRTKEIQQLGISKCGNSHAFMSDALGVGALVETADNYTILLKRSEHCGEAVGLYDIPGGHPEPKELVGKIAMEDIDLTRMKESDVVDEIFNSTLSEIVDEVNIPLSTLTDPILLGISRNTTSAGRPSSEYYVKCSLSSDEIKERYNQGVHAEAEESTELLCVTIADILNLQEKKPDLWQMLAPSSKGCITLDQLYRKNRTPNFPYF